MIVATRTIATTTAEITQRVLTDVLEYRRAAAVARQGRGQEGSRERTPTGGQGASTRARSRFDWVRRL